MNDNLVNQFEMFTSYTPEKFKITLIIYGCLILWIIYRHWRMKVTFLENPIYMVMVALLAIYIGMMFSKYSVKYLKAPNYASGFGVGIGLSLVIFSTILYILFFILVTSKKTNLITYSSSQIKVNRSSLLGELMTGYIAGFICFFIGLGSWIVVSWKATGIIPFLVILSLIFFWPYVFVALVPVSLRKLLNLQIVKKKVFEKNKEVILTSDIDKKQKDKSQLH